MSSFIFVFFFVFFFVFLFSSFFVRKKDILNAGFTLFADTTCTYIRYVRMHVAYINTRIHVTWSNTRARARPRARITITITVGVVPVATVRRFHRVLTTTIYP